MDKTSNSKKSPGSEGSTGESERQSLLNRSKQIFGDKVELGKAPSKQWRNQPSDATADSDSTTDKRREQVRQAQRTHRQRTQTYIRTLEKEVLRLRNAEKDALARVSKLEQQVSTLLDTLSDNLIPVPANLFDSAASFAPTEPTGQVILNLEHPDGKLVSINFDRSIAAINSSRGTSTTREEDSPTPATTSFDGVASDHVMETEQQSPRAAEIHTSNMTDMHIAPPLPLQDPCVGIEFILALEAPCISHIHNSHLSMPLESIRPPATNPNADISNSGHVYSAALSLYNPSYSYNPSVLPLSTPSSYTISKSDLDKLLQTSLQLRFGGDDITPVEVWYRLQSLQPQNKGINIHNDKDAQIKVLQRLAEELVVHVTCVHYGAVLDLNAVNAIFEKFFPYSTIY